MSHRNRTIDGERCGETYNASPRSSGGGGARKRSRRTNNEAVRMGETRDANNRGARLTKTTIRTRFSEHSRRSCLKEMLWKLSLTFGVVLSLGTTTATELDDSVLLEARILSEKNRSLAAYDCPLDEDSGCQKVIVSFASAYGNTDPEFGTSDFERTNAKAMCVSQTFLNSLLGSTEVLTVDCDAPVTTAVTETTFENGEAIPWGADLVLQNQWDKIPDPLPYADPFVVCFVDSGLLVRHQDIVSVNTQKLY